jgi:hypothetical protein
MVSTTKSITTYKTLIEFCNKITCLNGIITPAGINKLEDELEGICNIINTHHYKEGQKHGHLASISIIPQNKYWIIIANANWTHLAPANPGAYSTAALGVSNAAAHHGQLVAKHKVLQASYANYLGVEAAANKIVFYTIGKDTLVPLKKQYI